MDVIQEFLVNSQYPVHKLVFPNAQTKLGRFLKTCMREARPLDVWTQHILFSIHRWEFMSWMTDILEKGEAILCERYVWSGLVYSCALAPGYSNIYVCGYGVDGPRSGCVCGHTTQGS